MRYRFLALLPLLIVGCAMFKPIGPGQPSPMSVGFGATVKKLSEGVEAASSTMDYVFAAAGALVTGVLATAGAYKLRQMPPKMPKT